MTARPNNRDDSKQMRFPRTLLSTSEIDNKNRDENISCIIYHKIYHIHMYLLCLSYIYSLIHDVVAH